MGQEEASLLVIMLLFPLEFIFLWLPSQIPMSVAYVHAQRQDEGLQGVRGQDHSSWSSHFRRTALGVFPEHTE